MPATETGVPKNDRRPMRQADIERRLANLAKAPRCGAKTRATDRSIFAPRSLPQV